METLITLGKTFGPWVALCVYLVYNNITEKKFLFNKITEIEQFQQNTLIALVTKSNVIIANNHKLTEALIEVIRTHPCLCSSAGLLKQVVKDSNNANA